MRYHVDVAPGGIGTTPATDAGIPGLNIDKLYTTGMPTSTSPSSGLPDFNFGYSLGANQCNCPLLESEHQYQFVNNWTKSAATTPSSSGRISAMLTIFVSLATFTELVS